MNNFPAIQGCKRARATAFVFKFRRFERINTKTPFVCSSCETMPKSNQVIKIAADATCTLFKINLVYKKKIENRIKQTCKSLKDRVKLVAKIYNLGSTQN